MTYGISLTNNYSETIISESTLSLVTESSGTLTASFKSGDMVEATNGAGKNAEYITAPFPYTDELYGGVRKTLYYYDLSSLTPNSGYFDPQKILRGHFFEVGVDDHFIVGSVNKNNPSDYSVNFLYAGIFYTKPTMRWKKAIPRDKTSAPTGYGMAIYDSSGYCHWAMDDEIFMIPDVVRSFEPWANYTWTSSFNGWLYCTIPFPVFAGTPTGSNLYGRFERTSTGLRWRYNTKMTATNWGTAQERENLRNILRHAWNTRPKPITTALDPSLQALMLANA